MSDVRQPKRSTYDAHVGLHCNGHVARGGFALVKRSYRVAGGRLYPDAPAALQHPIFDGPRPGLVAGTDFWPHKQATDVVVQGSAFAPRGVPVERMEVGVQVGRASKRAVVFGRRAVRYVTENRVEFEAPEPFTEMPVDYAHCYGGVDLRVQDEELAKEPPEVQAVRTATDHPGLYPRNPFGKGYIVEPGPLEDVFLPEVEDPSDLLTPERFLVRDPRTWFRQPLPWCFAWAHCVTFPRQVYFMPGIDAWYPGPEDESMPEVARGLLMAGYRSRPIDDELNPAFFQEASHSLVFRDLVPGTPIAVDGMHPELPRVGFHLPDPPRLTSIDGDHTSAVRPRLHHVVYEPAEERVHLVYGADLELHRSYAPGVHKHIPVGVRVDGDAPVWYDAPHPLRELASAANLDTSSIGGSA